MKRTQEVRVETCVSDVASDVVTDAGVLDVYGNAVVTASWEGQDLGGLEGLVGTELEAKVEGRPTEGTNTAALRAMRRAKGDAGEVNVPTGGGRPLPVEQRVRFERAFEHDFSHVRVHTDAGASEAADELNAHAFALGADLYFSAGTFEPGTAAGDRLLAHELTHVVQHDEGRLPTEGGVSSPSDPAEQEAYANEGRMVEKLGEFDSLASELGADGFRFWEDQESETETGSVAEEAPETSVPVDGMGFNDLAAACGAADFFDDSFGPKDVGVGDETVMRSEEEESSEEEPEEGSESWLIWSVRQFDPELADALQKGVGPNFVEPVQALLDGWAEQAFAEFGDDSVLGTLIQAYTEVFSTFWGVVQGDQVCCETFEGWLDALTESVDAWVRADSPLASLGAYWTNMGRTFAGIGGSIFDDAVGAVWEDLKPYVQPVTDAFVMLMSANKPLGDKVAEWLGIAPHEDGFTGLVGQAVNELISMAAQGARDAFDQMVTSFADQEWLHGLWEMADFAIEMRDGVAWLWNNWDNDTVWEDLGGLSAELPHFVEMAHRMGDFWTRVQGSLAETFGGGEEKTWLGTLLSVNPLFVVGSLVLSAASAIWDGLSALPWGDMADAAWTLMAFAGNVVGGLVDVVFFLLGALNPFTTVIVVMAGVLRMLPGCYKAPIFDLLITLMAAGSSILLLPFAAIPGVAAVLQEALLKSLEDMRGLSLEDKEQAINAFANIFMMGAVGDILLGAMVGTVEGLVEPFVQFGVMCWNVLMAFPNLAWAVVELIDSLGDAVYEPGTPKPEEDTPEFVAEPPEEQQPEVPKDPAAGFQWFRTFFEGVFDTVVNAMAEVIAGAATAMVEALIAAAEDPYEMARKAGYAIGTLALGFGIGKIFKAGAEAAQALNGGGSLLSTAGKGVEWAVEQLTGLLGVVLGIVTDLLSAAASILGKALGKALKPIQEAWEAFKAWLMKKLAWLRAWLAKPEKDEDASLKRKAKKRAQKIWAEVEEDNELEPESKQEKEIDEHDDRIGMGVNYDAEIEESGKTWKVKVTAKDDGDKGTDSHGDGWVATDKAGKKFLAPDDASGANEKLLNRALDRLEETWQEAEGDDPMFELKSEFRSEEKRFEQDNKYKKDCKLKWKFDEGAEGPGTVRVELIATPNITNKNRTLFAKVTAPRPVRENYEMNGVRHTMVADWEDDGDAILRATERGRRLIELARNAEFEARVNLENDGLARQLQGVISHCADWDHEYRAENLSTAALSELNRKLDVLARRLIRIGRRHKMTSLEDLRHPSDYVGPDGETLKSEWTTQIREEFYPSSFNTSVRRSWKRRQLSRLIALGKSHGGGPDEFWCEDVNSTWQPHLAAVSDAQIDHIEPVSAHWNRDGRNQDQAERQVWFNQQSNLQLVCQHHNGSKGGVRYERTVGKSFRGPGEG